MSISAKSRIGGGAGRVGFLERNHRPLCVGAFIGLLSAVSASGATLELVGGQAAGSLRTKNNGPLLQQPFEVAYTLLKAGYDRTLVTDRGARITDYARVATQVSPTTFTISHEANLQISDIQNEVVYETRLQFCIPPTAQDPLGRRARVKVKSRGWTEDLFNSTDSGSRPIGYSYYGGNYVSPIDGKFPSLIVTLASIPKDLTYIDSSPRYYKAVEQTRDVAVGDVFSVDFDLFECNCRYTRTGVYTEMVVSFEIPTEPEIAVEQLPSRFQFMDNACNIDFGFVDVDKSRDLGVGGCLSITNIGNAPLEVLEVTKTGHAEDFVIGELQQTWVEAGYCTTFTVAFAPTAKGWRYATLHIYSSDADENPFEISLRGIGVPITPVITWAAPATITYGTELSAAQLRASANVPGRFVYSPAAGARLPVGTHELSADFTPYDAERYATAEKSVSLTVRKATAAIRLYGLSQVYNGDLCEVTAVTAPRGLYTFISYGEDYCDWPEDAGVYAVTATIDEDSYMGEATGTLVIAKANQTITFTNSPALCFGDADYPLAATASSLLPVVYTSSAPRVATIVDGRLHMLSSGNVTVTASQSGNANWNAAVAVARTMAISKKSQVILFPAFTSHAMGDADIQPGAAASSGLPVAYASGNAAVATIVNGKVRVVGAGTAVITASQPGDARWSAANPVTQTLVAGKGSQTISFPPLPSKGFGDADFAPGATASSGLPVNYASSNPSVATIVAGKVHVTGYGLTTVTATQAGSANWFPAAPVALPLMIDKPAAKVTLSGLSQVYNGQPRVVTATTVPAGMTVNVTYAGAAGAPVSAGLYVVMATVVDGRYAGSTSGNLVVAKANQTVSFPAPAPLYFGDVDYPLGASASSLLPVTYASSLPAVATIADGRLHIAGGGSVTVTASQPGDANWNAAPAVSRTLAIGKRSQMIDFPVLASHAMGDADFPPGATASSGLPVTYASASAGVATIVNGMIHLVGPGTAVITATQAGNSSWGAATAVKQTLPVTKGVQAISFPELPVKTYGDADFAPGATASSGLPVAYASSKPLVASIVAGKIHLTGCGTTTITARQAGSAGWNPAAEETQVLTVSLRLTVKGGGITGEANPALLPQGAQRQVFASEPTTGKTFDRWTVAPATAYLGAGFDARADATTVVMPSVGVTLTAVYMPTPKLTVVGGVIEGTDLGNALVLPGEDREVFADEFEDRVFEKWSVVPPTAFLGEFFNPRQAWATVTMPPVSVTLTAVYVDAPGAMTVRVTGTVPEYKVSGMFWGVDNTTWTPVNDGIEYVLKPGTYTVSFKSMNLRWLPPPRQTVKVLPDQPSNVLAVATYVPVVAWALSAESAPGSGTVTLSPIGGQVLPGRDVTLTAKPTAGYVFVGWEGLEGMPAGSERRPSLKVAPARDAVYTARFRAASECERPVIAISAPSECMVGVGYSNVIGVNDGALPVTFSSTLLPAGLKLDAVTGVISGVPTKTGSVSVTVSAAGAGGAAAPQTCVFAVVPLPFWAWGSFNGLAASMDPVFALASMNVTMGGGISGKLTLGNTNLSFSAGSYAGRSTNGVFQVTTTAKLGVATLPVDVQVFAPGTDGPVGGVPHALGKAEGFVGDVGWFQLYRNVWADAGMTAVASNYIGYYTATLPAGEGIGSGYLAFTADKAGGVKTAGKLADGTVVSLSGTLILDEGGRVLTLLYAAPAAYKGGGFCGIAELRSEVEGAPVTVSLLDGVPFFWENRNPQATSEYGPGFARELGVSGGFYDTWINLRDYYENGLTVGGVGSFGPLLATVRITEFDWGSGLETPPRVSWTESTQAETAEASPNGLILGVTPATGAVGTGFSAPAIQLPFTFIDPDTGGVWYDYSGLENPAGLTFGFTRATGIFKGAFNVYYDYVSADDRTTGRQTVLHVVKKALFEGALTPVRADGDAEGRGFFPWADTGWYDSGRFDGNGEPILIAYPFSRSCDLQLIRP